MYSILFHTDVIDQCRLLNGSKRLLFLGTAMPCTILVYYTRKAWRESKKTISSHFNTLHRHNILSVFARRCFETYIFLQAARLNDAKALLQVESPPRLRARPTLSISRPIPACSQLHNTDKTALPILSRCPVLVRLRREFIVILSSYALIADLGKPNVLLL
jgi:hypothetical protein